MRSLPGGRAILFSGTLSIALLVGCGGGGGTPPPILSVAVSPATVEVVPNASQTFSASLTNANLPGISWSVQEGATGGSITSAGVYTAPSIAGVYHVLATSQEDSTKSATAVVTVPITVTVLPNGGTLTLTQNQTFTASVAGTSNQNVTWSIQEGAAGGTITTTGVYTAPRLPGTYHVTATSQADSTRRANVTVVVQSGSASGNIQ